MPTLKNLSYGALTIERPGSDPLTLGPRETAEISSDAFESDEVQRHLRDRRIAILPGASARGESAPAPAEGRAAAPAREGSRNAPPTPTPAE